MKNKLKLKKGDEVIVIAGKDKGKTGKITKMHPGIFKAIVSGVNKVKNFTILCHYWWRGKDLNLRPSGYEFFVQTLR